MATNPSDLPTRDGAEMLAEVAERILRRYPDAVQAYLNHPGGDVGDTSAIILWSVASTEATLWPDEHGEVFQRADEAGERFWLDERDGDPHAELAAINALLTAVWQQHGDEMFEPGELGGGWYLPLATGGE